MKDLVYNNIFQLTPFIDVEPEQRRLLNKGDYIPAKQTVKFGVKDSHTLNILLDEK